MAIHTRLLTSSLNSCALHTVSLRVANQAAKPAASTLRSMSSTTTAAAAAPLISRGLSRSSRSTMAAASMRLGAAQTFRRHQSTTTATTSTSPVSASISTPPIISSSSSSNDNINNSSNNTKINNTISSSPTTNTTSTATATKPARSSSSTNRPLTWPVFLRLRAQRRRLNLAASIVAGGATMMAGASALVTQDPVRLSALLFNLDPVVTMGLCTLACGAAGWLAGPMVGGAVFRAGGWGGEAFRQMERNFYQRIKKHRVDPSSTSYSNPVPDYYGERISSVAGYRQWLKDQRAFTRKRQRV